MRKNWPVTGHNPSVLSGRKINSTNQTLLVFSWSALKKNYHTLMILISLTSLQSSWINREKRRKRKIPLPMLKNKLDKKSKIRTDSMLMQLLMVFWKKLTVTKLRYLLSSRAEANIQRQDSSSQESHLRKLQSMSVKMLQFLDVTFRDIAGRTQL